MSTDRRRVRVHLRRLEGAFESEAGILEIDESEGTVHTPPDEPLRSAKEERTRGDYWRTEAIFYRLKLWQLQRGTPRIYGDVGARIREGYKKCPCIFDWLVEQLSEDPQATNNELAARFPEDGQPLYRGVDDDGRLTDFRDDCHDRTGRGRLSRHGFSRYATKARATLGIVRRQE